MCVICLKRYLSRIGEFSVFLLSQRLKLINLLKSFKSFLCIWCSCLAQLLSNYGISKHNCDHIGIQELSKALTVVSFQLELHSQDHHHHQDQRGNTTDHQEHHTSVWMRKRLQGHNTDRHWEPKVSGFRCVNFFIHFLKEQLNVSAPSFSFDYNMHHFQASVWCVKMPDLQYITERKRCLLTIYSDTVWRRLITATWTVHEAGVLACIM